MIDAKQNMKKAMALVRDVAANPKKYPNDFIAIPLDEALLATLFSKERVRLLKAVRDRGEFRTVASLAKKLGRDETRVGRDLATLSELGLIIITRDGKTKRVTAPRKPIILA